MIYGSLPASALSSAGYTINASRGGRMSLPVAPSNYIYSHFRHVSGTPAPEGTQGVTISRLKILDALIERLVQIKKQGTPAPDTNQGLSPDRIDALIEEYKGQIRQAQATATVQPYKPVPAPSPGAIFNLAA